MAKTIPQLTDATTVNAADELIIQQGGITKRATANELFSGTATVTSTGSTTGRSLKDRFADMVNVKDFGAVGDGVADDTAAISLALAAGQQIVFPHGDYLITTNITVGAGKALVFNTGASVTSTTTNTLNFNNNAELVADRSRIFKGSASCTNIKTAYPEWWGATHSTTTTSNEAFQAALDALKTHGTLALNNGFYAIDGSTALSVSNGQIIEGAGGSNTNFVLTTAATNLFAVTTTRNAIFKGFRIAGASGITPTSGTAINFNQTSTTISMGNFVLDDIRIERVFNALNFQGNTTRSLNTGFISNIHIRVIFNYCVRFQRCENIFSYNININADTGSGSGAPSGGFVFIDKCQTVDLLSCHVSNSSGKGLLITNSSGGLNPGDDVRWCKFTSCYFDDCEDGANLNGCAYVNFVNCWFCSNGRSFRGYAGNGVFIRDETIGLTFNGGTASNNGQRAFRIDAGAKKITVTNMSIAGNSVNDLTATAFYAIDVFGNAQDFSITNNVITGDGSDFTSASPGDSRGIQVRSGTSDNYVITSNLINSINGGAGNALTDGGTGINKIVTGNITW